MSAPSGTARYGPALLALVGPTASGKTEASITMARQLDAEILCIDSMLVYRGMDAGTAKPTPEQRRMVPHHLLDIVDPADTFSVARFQASARACLGDLRARGRRGLLVGGGGLYYRAVVDGLEFPGDAPATRALLEAEATVLGSGGLYRRLREVDAAAAARMDPANVRRTIRALEVVATTGRAFSAFGGAWGRFEPDTVRAAGVELPREVLHGRIRRRVAAIMPALLSETLELLERGFERFLTSTQAIGYAEAVAALRGRMSAAEAAEATVRRTKALARRQMTWLRRDPRIRWFPAGDEGAPGVVEKAVAYLRGGATSTRFPGAEVAAGMEA